MVSEYKNHVVQTALCLNHNVLSFHISNFMIGYIENAMKNHSTLLQYGLSYSYKEIEKTFE